MQLPYHLSFSAMHRTTGNEEHYLDPPTDPEEGIGMTPSHGVPTHVTRSELDLQDALNPEVEYYDWKNTYAACISPVPSHPAYRANFSDYIKNRESYIDTDSSERTRLSFYLPMLQARLSADIAAGYRISFSKFISYISEIGLITLQIDYHDQYHIAKIARTSMLEKLINEDAKRTYLQLDKMAISLGSISGHQGQYSRHFSPSVPSWLYNAINDVAVYLNMSKSDVIFLCWNIGMKHSIDSQYKGAAVVKEVDDLLGHFDYELRSSAEFTDVVVRKLNSIGTIDSRIY